MPYLSKVTLIVVPDPAFLSSLSPPPPAAPPLLPAAPPLLPAAPPFLGGMVFDNPTSEVEMLHKGTVNQYWAFELPLIFRLTKELHSRSITSYVAMFVRFTGTVETRSTQTKTSSVTGANCELKKGKTTPADEY